MAEVQHVLALGLLLVRIHSHHGTDLLVTEHIERLYIE